MLRRTFVLLAVLLLASCVSKPTMVLDHAEIRTAGPQGIGMEVFFRVHNDNGFDVAIRNVRVTVTFAGRHSLPVSYSPNQWLRSDTTTIVATPVLIPWGMVPALLGESVRSASIPYRVRGSADVTGTSSLEVEVDDFEVDEKGFVPRAAIADAAMRASPIPIPFLWGPGPPR